MNRLLGFLLLFLPLSVSAAVTDLGTSMPIDPTIYTASILTFAANVIDADGEKFYYVCQIPKTGLIRRLAYKTVTVTTGSNLDATIETLNTTNGLPSGSLYCANSSATAVTVNTDDNVWKESSDFSSDCSATQGDYIAIGLTRPAGSSFNGQISAIAIPAGGDFGYEVSSTGASGFVKASAMDNLALVYNDGSYGFFNAFTGALAYTATVWNSGSNPVIRGNVFTPPFTFSFSKVFVFMDADSPTVLEVWDRDGSSLMTSVVISSTTDLDTSGGTHVFILPGTVTWYANKSYRITIRPTTTTGSSITFTTFSSAAIENAQPFGSRITYTTTNTNPPTSQGDWTQTSLQRFLITPMISGIDFQPGGSYGVSH